MRSVLIKVQILLVSSLSLLSCSKHNQFSMEEINSKNANALKSLDNAPMPKDSVELDSLNRPGFN